MTDDKTKARKIANATIKLAAALRAKVPADEIELLRNQCEVWSDLASDLSWISSRQLSSKALARSTITDVRSNQYWQFLERAYEGLGLGREQSLSNVRELRRNFNAVEAYGPVLLRPPMDRLAVAASVGAVRGQVCTLADLLAKEVNDGPSYEKARNLLVKVSVALPTALLFMASTNASEIPANLESFGQAVVRVAEWGLEEAGKPEAHLQRQVVQELSLEQMYATAALRPPTIPFNPETGLTM